MTTLLALDTSGDACSCALLYQNRLLDSFAIIPRQHAAQILPMIRELMQQAGLEFTDLDAIAFGQGPGSFTGLRIATGVTQGIAYAANLPVLPVSTLAALAYQMRQQSPHQQILSVIDARIDEIYWGVFDTTGEFPRISGVEHLTIPELVGMDAGITSSALVAVGSGLAYRSRFTADLQARLTSCFPNEVPRASAIAMLGAEQFRNGNSEKAAHIKPVYLRDQVARKPG